MRLARYRKLPTLSRMVDVLLTPRPLADALRRLGQALLASFGAEGAYLEASEESETVYLGLGTARPRERAPARPGIRQVVSPIPAALAPVLAQQGFPADTRSYLAASFAVRRGLEGYVALGSTREKSFRPADLPELVAFARLGSLAIANARLTTALSRR
jgi:hypothetical protein